MTFFEYIENLAKENTDVKHIPDTDIHFISSEAEKHTSLDSVLKYPGIILDRGDGFKYGGSAGAYTKNKDYVLFVVEHVEDTSNYAKINAALDKCESICDYIVNQIASDKRKPEYRTLLGSISIEGIQGEYVQNYDKQEYGVVVTISVEPPYKGINCK